MPEMRACRELKQALKIAREKLKEDDNNDNNNNKNVVTIADEDFVMSLMMDCFSLLAYMQYKMRLQEEWGDIPANNAGTRMARNKVFKGALSVMGNSWLTTNIGVEQSERGIAVVDELLLAFADTNNDHDYHFLEASGGKGWLPLHWAVVLASSDQHAVTAADVETLYSVDPMAIQVAHIEGIKGFNPAHLLCASPATPISMQFIRTFSLCCPTAFGSATATSGLHVACRYGTPTVELLQHLLQLDSSQSKVKGAFEYNDDDGRYPLGQLCFNFMARADELPKAEDLVNCLLEVDKSVEIVGDAVISCFDGYDRNQNGRLYRMVEKLLKANPEAAKCRSWYGGNILHRVSSSTAMPSQICVDVMKLVLALHKDAAYEGGSGGELPVHYAAKSSDLEVVAFLLRVYPGASTALTGDARNLLHFAVLDADSDRAVSKVRYLCSRYPAMILQRDRSQGFGDLPVHRAAWNMNFKIMHVLYEAGGLEQFKTPVAPSTQSLPFSPLFPHFYEYLPLHFLLSKTNLHATSDFADIFRWLLRLHPEAAGIEGGVGTQKKTPYQIAVDKKLPDYYLRLLLRAAPALDPAELHRLNYEQRRGAMFLAFKAVPRTLQAPLLARLRGESKDLVQRVVSFL